LEPSLFLLTEFGVFAFESGQKCLQEGTLDKTKLRTVLKTFEAQHPDTPA
jgi:hypothetical protein